MQKKNKLRYIFICAILILIITIGYFIVRNNGKNNIKGEPMTKELFYNISENISFKLDINKNYEINGDILTLSKETLEKTKNNSLDLNKYYFVNINGNMQNRYMKAYVMLYTYKDNTLIEQFKLGINSLYNVIYLTKEYDTIKLEIAYSGEGSFTIDNIQISEILEFKELDISSVKVDNTYIEDFDMAEEMFNTAILKANEEKLINDSKNGIFTFQYKDEYIEIETEDFTKEQSSLNFKREVLLRINGFANCLSYINLYKETGNTDIIKNYYNLIESWIDNYKYHSQEDELIYNDMATAYRVYNWTRFYEVAEKYLNTEQKTKFLTSLIYQANLLEETHYNAKGTNHGLYQDISNLFYLQVIKNKYNSEEDIKNAVNNIEKYFEYCVSEQGVHLEHSPDYHVYMIEGLNDLINIFKKLNLDVTKLQTKLEKMEEFLIYVTMPNNQLPEIGDTGKRTIELTDYVSEDVLKNKSQLPTDTVYKDEGYAIFRKDWISDTYILFYNAYNSYYHKHSDENGLWIYRDGDIIREAGKNGYNYDEPYTKYAYSSWGHNTLIVNGKGLVEEKNIPNDYNYDGTYIEDYNITDSNNVWVTGVNTRYDNVTHKRKVNYNKTEDIVYVTDNINSTEENEYTILWNLAPDITAKSNGTEVELYRNEELIMVIEFETDKEYSIALIEGQTEPRIIGWCTQSGEITKTTTIKVDFDRYNDIYMTTKFVFKK